MEITVEFLEILKNGMSEIDTSAVSKIMKNLSDSGMVILLKADGIRTENKFTVVLQDLERSGISARCEGDSLAECLIKTLDRFASELGSLQSD